MIVSELIAELQKLPGDLPVFIRTHDWEGYEPRLIETDIEYVQVEHNYMGFQGLKDAVYLTDEL